MEDHAESPACHAKVSKKNIIFAQRISRWDGSANVCETVVVRPEVEEGEDDGGGFLCAEEPVEGPFAVELLDGQTARDALVGDYVLAGVVALGGAIPKEEFVVEDWEASDCVEKGGVGRVKDIRILILLSTAQFSRLQTCKCQLCSYTAIWRLTSTHSRNSGRRSPRDALADEVKASTTRPKRSILQPRGDVNCLRTIVFCWC